jgi:hypothetical protein
MTSPSHINKMLWTGSITKVDEPSDGSPGGSEGKRVVFTKKCAMENVSTFNQMPLNCTFAEGWFEDATDVLSGHGDKIIGYIEETWVEGNDIMAKGVIWKNKFPDVAFMVVNGKQSLGFSVELYADEVHDGEEDGFLYVDKFTGTGCAILWQNTCAFGSTRITELVAKKETDSMDKEQIKAMVDEFAPSVALAFAEAMGEKFAELALKFETTNTQIEQLAMSIVELKASKEEQVVEPVIEASSEPVVEPVVDSEEVVALKAQIEELKASKEPQRQTAQFASVVSKFADFGKDKVAEINANANLSTQAKFAEILKTKFAQ